MCRIRYFTVARICLHEFDPVYCQQMFFFLKNLSIVVPTGVKSLFYTLLYLGQVQPIPLMFSSIDGHGWCSVRLVATDDVRFDWWPQMMISSTGDHRWCSVPQVTTDDDQFHRWPQMMFSSTGYHRWCWLRQVATDDAQIDRWPRMMFSSAGGHGWCSVHCYC